MILRRAPSGPLRAFVSALWYSDERAGAGASREHVLPTGSMHLVVRLGDDPLRVYDAVDARSARVVGTAIIGGARASFYVRDVSRPSRSVGAMLRPGASLPLFGTPADELAGRHTSLDEVWGRDVDALRDRLRSLASPGAQLAAFEALLAARLPHPRGVHPAVAHALRRLDATADVGAIVAETGYSHRQLIALFRAAVGLTPKRHARVLRFQRVLARLEADPAPASWTTLALDAGYSDQAHFTREFRELSGVTPGRFRALAPRHAHHLPVGR